MARTRCTVDAFERTLTRVLEKYENEIFVGVDELAEATAKATAREISANARGVFNTKKYAGGWTQKKTGESAYGSTWTTYNRSAYQLAHLLEYGHALKGGGRSGRVEGREHIKNAEEKAVKTFEEKVKELAGGK